MRMVSDPKCYNPKIVRHLNMRNHKQMSQEMFRDRTLRQAIEGSLHNLRASNINVAGSGSKNTSPFTTVLGRCIFFFRKIILFFIR